MFLNLAETRFIVSDLWSKQATVCAFYVAMVINLT